MISGKTLSGLAAGMAVLGFGVTMAFAAADDTIKARQACMKAHGGEFAVIQPIMKGEKPYDAAALKTAYDAADAACADYANFWGEDTKTGETVETFAKEEIWTDAEGFKAAGGAFWEAYQAVRNAADEAAFKAAVPEMGKQCGACHEKYRRPKG
ncbi:MAG: cytochrome c [Hyphomicrobiaceae bacterium]